MYVVLYLLIFNIIWLKNIKCTRLVRIDIQISSVHLAYEAIKYKVEKMFSKLLIKSSMKNHKLKHFEVNGVLFKIISNEISMIKELYISNRSNIFL